MSKTALNESPGEEEGGTNEVEPVTKEILLQLQCPFQKKKKTCPKEASDCPFGHRPPGEDAEGAPNEQLLAPLPETICRKYLLGQCDRHTKTGDIKKEKCKLGFHPSGKDLRKLIQYRAMHPPEQDKIESTSSESKEKKKKKKRKSKATQEADECSKSKKRKHKGKQRKHKGDRDETEEEKTDEPKKKKRKKKDKTQSQSNSPKKAKSIKSKMSSGSEVDSIAESVTLDIETSKSPSDKEKGNVTPDSANSNTGEVVTTGKGMGTATEAVLLEPVPGVEDDSHSYTVGIIFCGCCLTMTLATVILSIVLFSKT